MRKWLEGWGFLALMAVCVAVIAVASYAGRGDTGKPSVPAQTLEGERLSDVQYQSGAQEAQKEALARPVAGDVLQGYSDSPVYDAALALWHAHPAVAFAAVPGEPVLAIYSGRVGEVAGDTVRIAHEDGLTSEYTALVCAVQAGERVRAGQKLGAATGDSVRVALLRDGEYVNEWEGME